MKTKDYGLTCLLLCKGHEMVKFASDDLGRVWFEFANGNTVDKLVNEFYMNTASVFVGDFLAAQKRIKGIIFRGNEDGTTRKDK